MSYNTLPEILVVLRDVGREISLRHQKTPREELKEVYDKHHFGRVDYQFFWDKNEEGNFVIASIGYPSSFGRGVLAEGFGQSEEDAKDDAALDAWEKLMMILPLEEEDPFDGIRCLYLERPFKGMKTKHLVKFQDELNDRAAALRPKDPKTVLHEFCYSRKLGFPQYVMFNRIDGKCHVAVSLPISEKSPTSQVLSIGISYVKKDAEKKAAEVALAVLEKLY